MAQTNEPATSGARPSAKDAIPARAPTPSLAKALYQLAAGATPVSLGSEGCPREVTLDGLVHGALATGNDAMLVESVAIANAAGDLRAVAQLHQALTTAIVGGSAGVSSEGAPMAFSFFAVPLLLDSPGGAPLPKALPDDASLTAMTASFKTSGFVVAGAEVALIPYLYQYSEVSRLPASVLFHTGLGLARSLLHGAGKRDSQLQGRIARTQQDPDGQEHTQPLALDGPAGPHPRLRYLLGCVVYPALDDQQAPPLSPPDASQGPQANAWWAATERWQKSMQLLVRNLIMALTRKRTSFVIVHYPDTLFCALQAGIGATESLRLNHEVPQILSRLSTHPKGLVALVTRQEIEGRRALAVRLVSRLDGAVQAKSHWFLADRVSTCRLQDVLFDALTAAGISQVRLTDSPDTEIVTAPSVPGTQGFSGDTKPH